MSFIGDGFVENLRLRRRITFWRVIAFLVIGGLVFSWGSVFRGGLSESLAVPYIGRIVFSGVIVQDLARDRQFASFAENPKIKAIILHMESGGGGAAASEAFHNAVKKVAEVKPVVVVAGSAMASGAYMVAMAANHIVAYNSSIIGSVGMILQSPNFHELGKKIGVKVDVIRSGKLKALPSTLEEFTEEARSAMEHSIGVANDFFLSMVAECRKITDPNAMQQIATGKIFTGREALEAALIDEIGDETKALEWLKERGITSKIRDLSFGTSKAFGVEKFAPSSSLEVVAGLLRSLYYPGLIASFPGTFV